MDLDLPENAAEEESSGEGVSPGKSAPAREEVENEKHGPDMLLRFVEGRPVSEVTTTFLEWVCERLDDRGTDVWALVWDQVSWHTSHKVQNWID